MFLSTPANPGGALHPLYASQGLGDKGGKPTIPFHSRAPGTACGSIRSPSGEAPKPSPITRIPGVGDRSCEVPTSDKSMNLATDRGQRASIGGLGAPDRRSPMFSTSTPRSSNGRTTDFESVNRGSNPRRGSTHSPDFPRLSFGRLMCRLARWGHYGVAFVRCVRGSRTALRQARGVAARGRDPSRSTARSVASSTSSATCWAICPNACTPT
jgi:hypothetical protein